MDIAAKLSGKYTLADVFKQLFHQARVAARARAKIQNTYRLFQLPLQFEKFVLHLPIQNEIKLLNKD